MNLKYIILRVTKSKITSILVLLLLSTYINAQIISAVVLDSIHKTPLFGATVSVSNKIITLTDNNGKFQISQSEISNNDVLFIDYLGYETKKIIFKDVINNGDILMADNYFSLDEVIISRFSPKVEKDILNKISETFQKTFRNEMFLANINYKQIISLNSQPKGYFEFDGKWFMPSLKGREDITSDFWINESRRTIEDIDYTNYKTKNDLYKHHYFSFASTTFFNLFSYLVNHPLSSKNKNKFLLYIESTEIINGDEYYKIQFRQNKNVEYVNRDLLDISGFFYVQISNNEIYKESISFNWDNLSFSRFDFVYNKSEDGFIYPSSFHTILLSIKFNRKIMSESMCVVKSIPHKKLDKNFNSGIMLGLLMLKNLDNGNYNQEYWKKYPIENNIFFEKLNLINNNNDFNAQFILGSKDYLLRNPERINSSVELDIKRYELIKNYLK